MTEIVIRSYRPDDCRPLADLFRRAVREIARKDYSAEQVTAWAPDETDLERFHARRCAKPTFVAEIDGSVAGFSDIESNGHIDMLFVHPDHQRRGVAKALIEHVVEFARKAGNNHLTVEASITARPSFERQGFRVVTDQIVESNGAHFLNYRMERFL
jgi:putative acetyltransferase